MAAIRESLDEDAPRLIFADWLDEQGDVELAEFIRIQCRIATLDDELDSDEDCLSPGCDACAERRPLRLREVELLKSHALRWAAVPVQCCEMRETAFCVGFTSRQVVDTQLYFRRGFIDKFWGTAADWLRFADALLAAHPVRGG